MTVAPIDPQSLAAVLRRREEAGPLPATAYRDPALFAWEERHLFSRSWVCVGREGDVAEPGDVITARVGGDSLIVARGEDGEARAFFNVCQHRGTELVEGPGCSGAARLICPYHSWTYALDGRLVAAQHMAEARDFAKPDWGLSPVPLDAFGGWLFVNPSGTAGSLEEFLADFPPVIERFRPAELVGVAREEYEVAANWKALSENYQECYHCPTIHPELVRVTPYRSGGREQDSRGPWVGGPMDLAEGCTTMSLTGVSDRPPIPGLPEEDHRQVFYYSLLPNLWISCHPDYVMTHTVWPLAPDRTRVVCEWLFHPDQIAAPGFDPADAVEFWHLVNRQDWAAVERVQRGLASPGFRGGRYSDMEGTIHRLAALFARSYLEGRIARADELRLGRDGDPRAGDIWGDRPVEPAGSGG